MLLLPTATSPSLPLLGVGVLVGATRLALLCLACSLLLPPQSLLFSLFVLEGFALFRRHARNGLPLPLLGHVEQWSTSWVAPLPVLSSRLPLLVLRLLVAVHLQFSIPYITGLLRSNLAQLVAMPLDDYVVELSSPGTTISISLTLRLVAMFQTNKVRGLAHTRVGAEIDVLATIATRIKADMRYVDKPAGVQIVEVLLFPFARLLMRVVITISKSLHFHWFL